MKTWSLRTLVHIGTTLLIMLTFPGTLLADSWAAPSDQTYRSTNGAFEFFVSVPDWNRQKLEQGSRGTLRRKQGDTWERVWERELVNRVSPVNAMVTDSGRYVVTFDEWHSIGKKPVVIYGATGQLIAELNLADLKLENHPNISRSVSSYNWNEHAIELFGPTAGKDTEPWRRTLEDSLFIRLYWGEVIAIDLASGKVRDKAWWAARPAKEARELEKATKEYLNATWLRLAREYFRKENFAPDPTQRGVTGILLVGQLRMREALPLLREVAATDRFGHWAAPSWKTSGSRTVKSLAQTAIAEIE